MRRWPSLAILILVAGGCDGGGSNTRPQPSIVGPSIVDPTTSIAPAPEASSTAPATRPSPGSTTLHVAAVTFPGDEGDDLRVLLDPRSPSITVARTGGEPLEACLTSGLGAAPDEGSCRTVEGPTEVLVGAATATSAIAIRPADASPPGPFSVDDLSITYLPGSRSMTVVMPSLAPTGASCSAARCPVLRVEPAGAGEFTLRATAPRGSPRLSLEAGSRTLATVEGGNNLSIRATLDALSGARLVYLNPGSEAVPPLSMAIAWP